jgi:hypothetical protein
MFSLVIQPHEVLAIGILLDFILKGMLLQMETASIQILSNVSKAMQKNRPKFPPDGVSYELYTCRCLMFDKSCGICCTVYYRMEHVKT